MLPHELSGRRISLVLVEGCCIRVDKIVSMIELRSGSAGQGGDIVALLRTEMISKALPLWSG
jgi:hypothetical protein